MDVNDYIKQISNLSCKDFPALIKAVKLIPPYSEKIALVFKIFRKHATIRMTTEFPALDSNKKIEDALNHYYVNELTENIGLIDNLNHSFRVNLGFEDVGHVFSIQNGVVTTIAFSNLDRMLKEPRVKYSPEEIKQALMNAFTAEEKPKKLVS